MNAPVEPDLRERLNAYLDNELRADDRASLERALADDPQMQAEFHRLQRAWDLLDALPRSDVDAAFTQSTVEMISLDAADDLAVVEAAPSNGRWVDWCLVLGGAAVAAVAGFFVIDAFRENPDDALLRELPAVRNIDQPDLPVVRNLDVYGRTEPEETAEFFRALRDRQVLTQPPTPKTFD